MKILLAAGGTGGHINPALAIAQDLRLRHPDWEIAFAGNPDGMEGKLIPQADFPLFPLEVRGFRRSFTPSALRYNTGAVFRLAKALPGARRILKDFQPDLVIGTGGYVSGPLLYQAAGANIPTLIHEQNAFPGVTTKLLSKRVDTVLLPVEKAGEYLPDAKHKVLVGNPVRSEFFSLNKDEARKQLGIDDRFFIVSCGGSNGALMINRAVTDFMALHFPEKRFRHLHATGHYGFEWMPELLTQKGVAFNQPDSLIEVREYIHNMPVVMAAADLVINRAGASILAELAATGTPSILIPSPNVAENHQFYNAKAVEEKGAALVLTENELDGERLMQIITGLADDSARLAEMSAASRSLAVRDVCDRIYQQIRILLCL